LQSIRVHNFYSGSTYINSSLQFKSLNQDAGLKLVNESINKNSNGLAKIGLDFESSSIKVMSPSVNNTSGIIKGSFIYKVISLLILVLIKLS
jgi:hypothetical protein